ncbi:MAG: hypothetical protein QOH06_6327, partial [Acidobacteriota bacterium]|nr:hypothetical protein [Acidobacteriota bacterium]
MPEAHARRRAALRTELRERGLDALLVVDLLNLRYLTGFTGSNGALLVHAVDDARTVFCTDGRYIDQAARQVPELDHVIDRASVIALASRTEHGSRVGFESQHVSVDGFDAIAEAAESTELVRAPNLVERLRMIKDDTEIEALRMACAAADRALADLIEHGGVAAGRTEREVARDLENRMLDHGATKPAFESIVATGANSATPHHRPTDAVLRHGDFVKLDFGA